MLAPVGWVVEGSVSSISVISPSAKPKCSVSSLRMTMQSLMQPLSCTAEPSGVKGKGINAGRQALLQGRQQELRTAPVRRAGPCGQCHCLTCALLPG